MPAFSAAYKPLTFSDFNVKKSKYCQIKVLDLMNWAERAGSRKREYRIAVKNACRLGRGTFTADGSFLKLGRKGSRRL